MEYFDRELFCRHLLRSKTTNEVSYYVVLSFELFCITDNKVGLLPSNI